MVFGASVKGILCSQCCCLPIPEVAAAQEVLILQVQIALGLPDEVDVSTVDRGINTLHSKKHNTGVLLTAEAQLCTALT